MLDVLKWAGIIVLTGAFVYWLVQFIVLAVGFSAAFLHNPRRKPGRLHGWIIARRLGLRCLVCNRRAGYGGRCPNRAHNH